MQEDEFSISKFVPEEKTRKIFAKVFDRQTVETIHQLAVKGHFDFLEFVVSTGKEAHVFRARDSAGNFRAVKIYRIEATDFKNMQQYLEGDIRFKGVRKEKREIVFAWAKKEFRNLELLNKAGVRVPLPVAFKNNVLVMEFIGSRGEAAPLLKEKPVKDLKKLYEALVDFMAKMIYKGNIIHADLSEYNILNFNEKPVLIDCGQAVLTSHPHAKEFFERDVKNLQIYFSKRGLEKSIEEVYEDIRARK